MDLHPSVFVAKKKMEWTTITIINGLENRQRYINLYEMEGECIQMKFHLRSSQKSIQKFCTFFYFRTQFLWTTEFK